VCRDQTGSAGFTPAIGQVTSAVAEAEPAVFAGRRFEVIGDPFTTINSSR
jgi:hypothetical protein